MSFAQDPAWKLTGLENAFLSPRNPGIWSLQVLEENSVIYTCNVCITLKI